MRESFSGQVELEKWEVSAAASQLRWSGQIDLNYIHPHIPPPPPAGWWRNWVIIRNGSMKLHACQSLHQGCIAALRAGVSLSIKNAQQLLGGKTICRSHRQPKLQQAQVMNHKKSLSLIKCYSLSFINSRQQSSAVCARHVVISQSTGATSSCCVIPTFFQPPK